MSKYDSVLCHLMSHPDQPDHKTTKQYYIILDALDELAMKILTYYIFFAGPSTFGQQRGLVAPILPVLVEEC